MEKSRKNALILWFKDLSIKDVPLAGGKNAALGEMYQGLTKLGINVPNGFALTAHAYRLFLKEAGLEKEIRRILRGLDTHDIHNLQKRGREVREVILKSKLPKHIEKEIEKAYKELGDNPDVAVRSSATAEDLPDASFAGQQETFLNVRGVSGVLEATKKCIASLFTNRAISYRVDKKFSHFDAALSVGVQLMVRSDLASSGVAFTLDTETGFEDVVTMNGSYGLGEMVVQGKVTPDEFTMFKPTLDKGYKAIIETNIGRKDIKMIYAPNGTKVVKVSKKDREKFCITEKEIVKLAKWCVEIEKYFSKKRKTHQPMDIEWAKDGKTEKLFIVQARPETVHSSKDKNVIQEFRLKGEGKPIIEGVAVGTKIATGKVRVIKDVRGIKRFQKGEILVTEITDPDWEPIMKIASAIITDEGGRTSHAAIVSRELGIPCIVGTESATKKLKTGKEVTADCSSGETGIVYKGSLPFSIIEHRLQKIPETRTKVMVNIGSPDDAMKNHHLPAQGVGLGRLEFIIASHIGMHPNALLEYSRLSRSEDKGKRKIARQIEKKTLGYANKANYYVDEIAEGIGKIGAAFYPHEVIIRFSDFKTNEYRTLLGGELYEPEEENPMLGWRGASRYYDKKFKKAFGLECRALKKAREKMGLTNITPMIPFCRTPEEGRQVLEVMKENGLDRKKDKSLKVYVMCEIPSNILRADEFLNLFDGMSIGSNDLTQLTLGLDRDSEIIAHIGNEKDASVIELITRTIEICRKRNKYVGICGQAPSDHQGFAELLVREGIESISLNPDTVIPAILRIAKEEKRRKK
ncbi:phosphoenolpyruvate synthase [bacterium]|nr:phosphoenolpyruvate synthase [bacterium]|tara:strand:+ start:4923 stop:7337 length:2415 start_codon:yes stop_codon:yes gene_type:complete